MYYFKQQLKKISVEDSKTLYLLFKTATSGYNELINYNEKSGSQAWIEPNSDIVKSLNSFKKLGSNLTFSIVNNYNINMKNWKKNQAKDASYTKPTFRNKDSEFFIAFFGRNYSVNYDKGIVKLSLNKKDIEFPIAKNFNSKRKDLRMVRLHKEKTGYYLVYEYESNTEAIQGNNKAGIDLGVDVLISCYTPNFKPLIISGKYLKFVNYKHNLKLETLENKEDIEKLYKERDTEIKSIFNFAIKRLFDYLRYTRTTEIFIGDFSGVKDKVVARNFYQISYYLLKRKMKDYAKKNGVKINFIKEDYTSKTSFLDLEEPKFRTEYAGNREKRGLFITKEGFEIHADINGAAQILSKRHYVNPVLRNNIRLEPFFIDLVKDNVKLKSSLNFKIWKFLNNEYKRVSKINEIYNRFKMDPKNFKLRKMVSYDSLMNVRIYVNYSFDINNEICMKTE